MANVRTVLVCLLTVVVAAPMAACIEDGSAELVFVRQVGETDTAGREASTPTPLTSSSQVELTEPSVDAIRLCVLPFENLSDDEGLNYLPVMFHQSMVYNLEEFDRAFEHTVLDENRYQEMVDEMGAENTEVFARTLQERFNAEVILYGNIRVVEGEVRIEPFVISFDDGVQVRPLDAKPVKLSNFLKFIDNYVQDLLDEIIDQQRG